MPALKRQPGPTAPVTLEAPGFNVLTAWFDTGAHDPNKTKARNQARILAEYRILCTRGTGWTEYAENGPMDTSGKQYVYAEDLSKP
ncbi:hypothetical protein A0H81_01665 [Grifola frondosa]|uniref:Uncharacterized protein n=1 Tax=Grifola frondosa TaxID=5627 RepID=A0A1C7MLM3_GRIFR|nr:hypothetical protein A0H81_01665 [Grifola frondosa]